MKASPGILGVAVNHNTSDYAELMLRSLFATHAPDLNLAVTLYDNASTDDTRELMAFAGRKGVTVIQSGFTTDEENNSHGELLRRFVLENPACDYYLFLDADVCFIQPDTLPRIIAELEQHPDAFGAGPRMSWDGETPYPKNDNLDIYEARLHPCCALVRNTPLMRRVTEEIGMSCAKYLWAKGDEYLDTFKLFTKVMKTHGLRHVITTPLVVHFFSVSYAWDPEEIQRIKAQHRDELLAKYRAIES